MTWQFVDTYRRWHFGEMVRGLVRDPQAEVYFSAGAWHIIMGKDACPLEKVPNSGPWDSLQKAAAAVEKALGITNE